MNKLIAVCTNIIIVGVILCSTTMPLYAAFSTETHKNCHQVESQDTENSNSSCHSIEKTDLSVQLARTDYNDDFAVPVNLPQYLESEAESHLYPAKAHHSVIHHLRSQQTIVLRI